MPPSIVFIFYLSRNADEVMDKKPLSFYQFKMLGQVETEVVKMVTIMM